MWIHDRAFKPLIIGHRGSSAKYPENTLLAYRQAVADGADGIEVDIRKTNDNRYVCIHDGDLNRTTSGNGLVGDTNWDVIRLLDAGRWKSENFAGLTDTRVPLLEDVLQEFSRTNLCLFLNIKLP